MRTGKPLLRLSLDLDPLLCVALWALVPGYGGCGCAAHALRATLHLCRCVDVRHNATHNALFPNVITTHRCPLVYVGPAGEVGLRRIGDGSTAHAQMHDADGPSQIEAQAAATKGAVPAPVRSAVRWAILAPLVGLVALFAFAMVGVIGRPPTPGDASNSFTQFFDPVPLAPHVHSTNS